MRVLRGRLSVTCGPSRPGLLSVRRVACATLTRRDWAQSPIGLGRTAVRGRVPAARVRNPAACYPRTGKAGRTPGLLPGGRDAAGLGGEAPSGMTRGRGMSVYRVTDLIDTSTPHIAVTVAG